MPTIPTTLRAAVATAALTLSLAVSLPALAVTTVVPQSLLTPSGQFYTDIVGGGIGGVVVMNGGSADGRSDDGFSGPIDFGYTLSFFGAAYTQFYANNNGNISFGSGLSAFLPTGPTGANAPIISAWFGDVDTRGLGSGVLHLRNDTPHQTILTWDGVGYFSRGDDRLNSFQMVVRGPDYNVPAGEGQIGFFYKAMAWEATPSGPTAAVGFGNGLGDAVVLQGSNAPGLNTVVANHYVWFGQNLDVVTAVPESETYALMLAGLGVIGAMVRRRSRSGTTSARH